VFCFASAPAFSLEKIAAPEPAEVRIDGILAEFREGTISMSLTAEEIFARDVCGLPLSERLHLAAIILQDLTNSGVTVVEQRESWSDQDQHDLLAFSLQHASQIYPEEEDLV
jgi:hypothetical protein